MAKKENDQDIYINEDAKSPSRFRSWISSRPAKITAISVGAALALGFAFTGGALAGRQLLGGHDGPGFANSFDRDGDHGPEFDGKRPPKPGHGPEGHDGQERPGGKFEMENIQPDSPESTTAPSTTTP